MYVHMNPFIQEHVHEKEIKPFPIVPVVFEVTVNTHMPSTVCYLPLLVHHVIYIMG